MEAEKARIIIQLLRNRGVIFEKGLLDKECNDINHMFNINFPADLNLFLQIALPVSTGFMNWRKALVSDKEEKIIRKQLYWPLEGMLFNVENNAFWDKDWGTKPNSFEEQKEVVEQNYQKYPTLIPIYLHRYIPSYPNEEGNPIFSVCQIDIAYYGYDLVSYFCNEFHLKIPEEFKHIQRPKYITFWGKYVE
jgi:hypothetical protein